MVVRDEGSDSHFDCYLVDCHSCTNYVNIKTDPHFPRRILRMIRQREREGGGGLNLRTRFQLLNFYDPIRS